LREAERKARAALAARQRVDARADLLAHTRGGEQPETDDRRREELRARRQLLEPCTDRNGQQLGYHQIPDEELNDQRNVTEDGDVDGADRREARVLDRAQHAEERPDDQRDHPRAQRNGDRHPETGQQPAEIGGRLAGGNRTQQNAPVPVV